MYREYICNKLQALIYGALSRQMDADQHTVRMKKVHVFRL
jgi:hypothetical protein